MYSPAINLRPSETRRAALCSRPYWPILRFLPLSSLFSPASVDSVPATLVGPAHCGQQLREQSPSGSRSTRSKPYWHSPSEAQSGIATGQVHRRNSSAAGWQRRLGQPFWRKRFSEESPYVRSPGASAHRAGLRRSAGALLWSCHSCSSPSCISHCSSMSVHQF